MSTMDRWKRVQELFDSIEPLPVDRQRAELERAEQNQDLRSEVLRLLQALRDEEEAQEAAARLRNNSAKTTIPELNSHDGLTDVKLISLIGSGGAGAVYRAVRFVNRVEQQVAVKIYHAHRTAPADHERFAREQRMLATLTDPGIVRFFDSGIMPDGRPYLVMELAEGAHITRHCDDRRLGLEPRVQLLLQVCRAVTSAHARLILHLDLKPSNILVTPEGGIKLLDFGTAQLIEHTNASVVTEQLTPQYASPERLRGEAATLSSDVYSLGLILFELCSGGSPFPSQASFAGIADRAGGQQTASGPWEAVTAEAAALRGTTLDKLRRQLHGDLAAICGKALAFDWNQRYLTVSELSDDLRRYLRGEPVQAHAPRFSYLARKFIKRYWGRLTVAAIFVVGLSGAAAYSWVQARNAQIALERAEATQIFLSGILESGSYRQSNATVPQLLELAESRVAGLRRRDPALASDIELSLGMAREPADPAGLKSLQRSLELARASGDVAREASALSYLG
jgi:eukaryotic-like serine/threonine-protein kinase